MSARYTQYTAAHPLQHASAVSAEANMSAGRAMTDWLDGVTQTVRGVTALIALTDSIGDDSTVSPYAAFQAFGFLAQLPDVFPLPDIEAEPAGRLTFDWYKGPRAMLSVSLGKRDAIAYAVTVGPNASHGVIEPGGDFPTEIVGYLSTFYPAGT